MQPLQRGKKGTTKAKNIPAVQWKKARVPGKNGIYLLLVGLVWWATQISAADVAPTDDPEWCGLVKDISWAVENWPKGEGSTTKRGAGDATDSGIANKRPRRR